MQQQNKGLIGMQSATQHETKLTVRNLGLLMMHAPKYLGNQIKIGISLLLEYKIFPIDSY